MKYARLQVLLIGICLLLVLVTIPFIAACSKPAPTPAEVITLRFCSGGSGVVILDVAERFGSEVEKRTDGRVKFDYLWGGALAKPREELEACRSGLSEMAVLIAQNYPAELILNNFGVGCPLTPSDPELLGKVVYQLYEEVPELRAEFEAYNQKLIASFYGGGFDCASTVPIRHVEDFEGKSIAMSGTYWPKLFEAAGMVLVSMPFPETQMALQTGMIDGTMCSVNHVREWYDIFTDFTITRSGSFYCYFFTINTDTWDKLPEDIQGIIIEEGRKTTSWYDEAIIELENESLEYLKGKGINVHTFTDEDVTKFAHIAPEIPLMWIKDTEARGKPGAKVMEAYIALLEKHGYQWPKQWKTAE